MTVTQNHTEDYANHQIERTVITSSVAVCHRNLSAFITETVMAAFKYSERLLDIQTIDLWLVGRLSWQAVLARKGD